MELRDRYRGAIIGAAVADALGQPIEFEVPGSFPPVTGYQAGGTWNLPAGYWTDDTSLTICLAESLLAKRGHDPVDQLTRYHRWWRDGENSSTGKCFDIGTTTRTALELFEASGCPYCGSIRGDRSGNGSLMRLAPVPLYFLNDPATALEMAEKSSRTTHASRACLDGCRFWAGLIIGALQGLSKKEILTPHYSPTNEANDWCHAIWQVAGGGYQIKGEELQSTGYVVDTLEVALESFWSTSNFRDAVLRAVNRGGDSDTASCVCASLAGAYYGFGGIPAEWVTGLHDHAALLALADRLLAERL